MFELVFTYEILCPCSVIKQVPLGNFELDWLLFTADVFFSRALRDKQQVGLFTSHKCVLGILLLCYLDFVILSIFGSL